MTPRSKVLWMQGRDEIADAYDYWVHTHRKITFTYKDAGGGKALLCFTHTDNLALNYEVCKGIAEAVPVRCALASYCCSLQCSMRGGHTCSSLTSAQSFGRCVATPDSLQRQQIERSLLGTFCTWYWH